MQALDHIEAVITDKDVDADWQLIDATATLRPNLDQVRLVNAQLIQALNDD